jgi:hypothetical protein
MKILVTGTKFVAGKVFVGPKIIGDSYYRVVSQPDRSGRIEVLDRQTRSWSPAPETVAFNDVWKAADVSQLFVDMACPLPAGDDDDGSDSAEADQPGNGHDAPHSPEFLLATH